MSNPNRILITGAAGKVGQAFIHRLLQDPAYDRFILRALCHHRQLEGNERIEIVYGSIEQRATVESALDGVSHVVHLATCKETPDQIMDVAVKGLFWLLETCRSSQTFQQFILIGGDASLGHFVYPHPHTGHRNAKAFRLSGLLCPLQGTGRSDAGTILHPIQFERLLLARPVDYGKG